MVLLDGGSSRWAMACIEFVEDDGWWCGNVANVGPGNIYDLMWQRSSSPRWETGMIWSFAFTGCGDMCKRDVFQPFELNWFYGVWQLCGWCVLEEFGLIAFTKICNSLEEMISVFLTCLKIWLHQASTISAWCFWPELCQGLNFVVWLKWALQRQTNKDTNRLTFVGWFVWWKESG